ncbi:peptidoglycan-binding domain-containing protein [Metabacillus sp. SLBN-84]
MSLDAKAYSCNGRSAWEENARTENEGYQWIISKSDKGFVRSGGIICGVVLSNIVIDFSHAYLAKDGYSGNKSAYVAAIQRTLSCLGYSPGSADGIFGSMTERAVKAFQADKGLSSDGIVGKDTYYCLSVARY